MKKLLLIDGNSLLFRAFYATFTRMMKTSNNIPVNAVFTLSSMLDKVLKQSNPDYVLIALDKGKQTFRHKLFDGYKGTRKELPEELIPQFEITRELFCAYNIKFMEFDDYEADDIIGSMAKKYQDIDIEIISGDKDLFQLIDDNTKILMPKNGVSEIDVYTSTELFERYTLKPLQIIDLKALMGDPSDNIPGVKGVGEKTAIKLLTQYESIENIYNNISEIKGSLHNKLNDNQEICYMSKTLATIKTDIDLDVDLESLKLDLNYDTLYQFFIKYEMGSKAEKIKNLRQSDEEIAIEYHTPDVTYVSNITEDLLQEEAYLFFEKDPYDYFNGEFYGLGIKYNEQMEFIYYDDLLKDEKLLTYLKSDKLKYIFDYKNILHILDKTSIELNDNVFDLLLASFIVNTKYMSYEDIVDNLNLQNRYTIKDVYGTQLRRKDLDDNELVAFVFEKLNNLEKIKNIVKLSFDNNEVSNLLFNVEQPLCKILFEMENNGIKVDMSKLDEISEKTENKMLLLQKEIYEIANKEFNINSPMQLAVVLFDDLGLKANKKRSTSVDQLEKLVDASPIINLILEYRKYSKLYSTYAEGLKKFVKKDEKIHTIFKQTATLTGRLSSIEPNLQNISVRDEETKEIREAFIPSENNILLTCDYSQVELRMLAHLANEGNLIEAFNNDIDIHTKTASEVFGVAIEDVTSELRRKAKAINFGIIYGMTQFTLATQIDVSNNDAKDFIDNYFKTYPNIKAYFDKEIDFCKENGYVETILKRKRYIEEINSSNFMTKEFGKRTIMNTPIQGSAADLIKIAMVNVYKAMKAANLKSKMILQVHDELIFECAKDEVEVMKKLVVEEMENAMKLTVILKADLSVGNSWLEAK